ncbi:MAG: Aluminum resistance family protein [Bacilli bacterium]|nr:Aluminum resistance family protein [Bacilli bacterium]
MYEQISASIDELLDLAEREVRSRFETIDKIAYSNQSRVLDAFRHHRVADYHLHSSTGYGFNDAGREMIDTLYASVFGTEAALVRPHLVSGTHALTAALFGLLRPGDHLLFLTGNPYDTLQGVTGLREERGSLKEWGIDTSVCPLAPGGQVDYEQAGRLVRAATKVVALQRSSGYDWRPSFTVDELEQMIHWAREYAPQAYIIVDNCYGEFVEQREPSHAGADLVVGSLIKNPGGGLAHSGGYLAGNKTCVELASLHLTAPGIGAEQGASLGQNRGILQGLFLAPHVVSGALKGSLLAANVFGRLGLKTKPLWTDPRTDLIQAIEWGSSEALILFCQAVQAASPIDSGANPQPWDMPGYDHQVIMAAGTFVQGATLELSADGPIRAPYIGYLQGGLTYEHCKYALKHILLSLHLNGLISIDDLC